MKSAILVLMMSFGCLAAAQQEIIIKGQYGEVKITVSAGDMTRVPADAYVVPQFKGGASDGGVGGAIYRSGAEKGMDEYDQAARSKNMDFGDAMVTKSGGGNSTHLIHTVTVGSGANNEFNNVQSGIKNGLLQADAAGIKSVASPTLGTGIIGQLTDAQSARAIFGGVQEYVDSPQAKGGIKEFKLVVYGSEKLAGVYRGELKKGDFRTAAETGQREFDPKRWTNEFTAPGRASAPRDATPTETEVARSGGVMEMLRNAFDWVRPGGGRGGKSSR